MVVRVLSPPDKELVSHVVSAIIDHEAAALHPAGVAPAQVGGHVSAVAAGLIGTTLEVPVLVEDDLKKKKAIRKTIQCTTDCIKYKFILYFIIS